MLLKYEKYQAHVCLGFKSRLTGMKGYKSSRGRENREDGNKTKRLDASYRSTANVERYFMNTVVGGLLAWNSHIK